MASWPRAWHVEAGSLASQLTHKTVGMGLLGCQMRRMVMVLQWAVEGVK